MMMLIFSILGLAVLWALYVYLLAYIYYDQMGEYEWVEDKSYEMAIMAIFILAAVLAIVFAVLWLKALL